MTIPYPTDLSLPGAVDRLLAHHWAVFGDSRMETSDPPGGEAGTDPAGSGEARTDSPKPTPPARPDGDRSDSGQLGEGGKKALDAERANARAEKARADKAERELEEMRRQQMTEQERVVAERDDWRAKYEEQAAQLAARDLDLMRRDVAAEKNLPPALARRLYGTTREELEQDADALVALLPDPQAPRTPKPDLSAGSTGDSGKPSSVADAMARYQARRERSGATT